MRYDVCIIGAGVIGCSIARELAKYELKVLLLEKSEDVSNGASKANSGIVHGAYSVTAGTQKARFCTKGNALFANLDAELHFGYKKIGSLVLAFSDADEAMLKMLQENSIRNGSNNTEILSAKQLEAYEENLSSTVQSALFCPDVGICSPYELTIALAENAVANDLDLKLNHEVTAIEQLADEFLISTNGGSFSSTYLINAAGVHTADISQMLGDESYHIRPRKGQYLLFDRAYEKRVKHVIFQTPTEKGKGILVTPTIYGNLMVGPDAQQIADVQDLGTDKEALKHITETAELSIPELDLSKIIRSFSGLRASSDSGDFIIRESSACRNFFHAAGIESPGLTAAPAIAQHFLSLLESASLSLEKKRIFHSERKALGKDFPDLNASEVMQRINLPEGNSQRIVCRCEQVSEAVISEVFERGIPIDSTDAVKRRTRAGMGRCQGQFCRPRVAELIARHTGIAVESVRLPGNGTGILPHRVKVSEFKKYMKEIHNE